MFTVPYLIQGRRKVMSEKKVLEFKVKQGRPRSKNPSHQYTPKQRQQHQSENLEANNTLRWLKRWGLFPLLNYSLEDLLRSVRGKKPDCFALGDWGILPLCKECEKKDATSPTEGFYDPRGGELLGKDPYGIYCACWIASWVHHLRTLKLKEGG
jgi:hypothetical protein